MWCGTDVDVAGVPGSMGGMPGMPDMATLLQDPELLTALQVRHRSALLSDSSSEESPNRRVP